jgi:hypothetical protein
LRRAPANPHSAAGAECPPHAALAAFAEESAPDELLHELIRHLARCDECSDVVAETVRFLARPPTADTIRP